MAAIGIIGGLFSFLGSIASANAARSQADAEIQAANYRAGEEERLGKEELAVGSRKSIDEHRKTALIQSELQAKAAASGGGAADPTIIKLASDIEGQGEYNALSQLWTGQSHKVALDNQAALDRYSGQMRAKALRDKADATILGGIGGLFGSFARFG